MTGACVGSGSIIRLTLGFKLRTSHRLAKYSQALSQYKLVSEFTTYNANRLLVRGIRGRAGKTIKVNLQYREKQAALILGAGHTGQSIPANQKRNYLL